MALILVWGRIGPNILPREKRERVMTNEWGLSHMLVAAMTMSTQARMHLSNDRIKPESPIGAKDRRSSKYIMLAM